MNLKNILGIAFSAALLCSSLSVGTVYGADLVTGSGTPVVAPATPAVEQSPELKSAAERIDLSKTKLDQARQQLSAAKAMLKAAEAEYKAARADQEALSLRSEARKLADASGLQDTGAQANRLYPVDLSQVKSTTASPAAAPGSGTTVMMGLDNRLQQSDVKADPQTPVVAPGQPFTGAPAPASVQ